MSEEEKIVAPKVVVRKVVKKVVSSVPKTAEESTVASKPIAKTIVKTTVKPTIKDTDSEIKPVVKKIIKPVLKTIDKPIDVTATQSSSKPIAKPLEKISSNINEESKMSAIAQPIDKTISKPKKKPIEKTVQKKSKTPLILILITLVLLMGGIGLYFTKSGGSSNNGGDNQNSSSGGSIFDKIMPAANAALIIPTATRLPTGAPLWVHLVNSAGDAEALKNGPAKALNAYKELKEASPFVLLTPVPPKEGWLKPDKIKELAAEIQKTMKDQKCDATRLVISGEGVGTTAALLLAGELNGAVGAVLGIGAPSEEAFVEVERFRYVPIRFLAPASDKDAVGWTQKIAGDLRGMGCAVSVTEISPSPNLIGGAWGAPEIWAWMVTRRVADANTRAGIDSLLAWSAPKRPAGIALTAKPAVVDEAKLLKGSLFGEYFDGVAFNTKILDRMDKSINIPDRAYQLPDNKADNVSVRWTGLIKIDKEGVYTFYSSSDDGQRVLVGGVAVVDDWADHGATEKSGTIKLAVGWYTLVVEHYQGGGGGSITSWWSGPGFEKKLIEGDAIATLKPNPGK